MNLLFLKRETKNKIRILMDDSGEDFNSVAVYLIEKGIESLISEAEEEKKRNSETVIINTFDFVEVQLQYKKSNAPEPEEYNLKIKELYRKNEKYYIKAVKSGERSIKSFRVDRICKLSINGLDVSDPLQFLMNGEITTNS